MSKATITKISKTTLHRKGEARGWGKQAMW